MPVGPPRGQRRGRSSGQRRGRSTQHSNSWSASYMTKRIRAKHKIDRRLGENIWGRPKSPLNRRESRPGQHGERRVRSCPTSASSSRPSRSSRATTRNITSASSAASTTRPSRLKGSTSEHLIGLLERRLDAVVYRAKFVPTVFAARQFVSHGHVTVNGRRVTDPELPLQGRRRDRGEGEGAPAAAGARGHQERRARRARLRRGRPQQDDGQARRASRRCPTCPIRCTMEPNLVVEFYSR